MYYDDIYEVRLSGYLTTDPEVVKPENGVEFAKVSLATNRGWYRNHEYCSSVEYNEVIFNFKPDVKVVLSKLTKGDRIELTGRPKLRKWQGKDGVERVTPTVIAGYQSLRILKAKSSKENAETPEAHNSQGGANGAEAQL